MTGAHGGSQGLTGTGVRPCNLCCPSSVVSRCLRGRLGVSTQASPAPPAQSPSCPGSDTAEGGSPTPAPSLLGGQKPLPSRCSRSALALCTVLWGPGSPAFLGSVLAGVFGSIYLPSAFVPSLESQPYERLQGTLENQVTVSLG